MSAGKGWSDTLPAASCRAMTCAEELLSHRIDYAGLFPPAGLDLQTTVENFAAYRGAPDAWALGRLVLPAAKAADFAERWPVFAAVWPIALLVGEDVEREVSDAAESGMMVDWVECRPSSADTVGLIQRLLPGRKVFFEIPAGEGCEEYVAAIAECGGRAKLRTGGVTPDAIPAAKELARVFSCCIEHKVTMKATAGLHHPFRGDRALTYESDSPRAKMHGFVNVVLAVSLLRSGRSAPEAEELLEEDAPESFKFASDRIRWRDWSFTVEQIQAVRQRWMGSFGSCSFTEPLEDLRAMGLLR
jgi:hypothetical protein